MYSAFAFTVPQWGSQHTLPHNTPNSIKFWTSNKNSHTLLNQHIQHQQRVSDIAKHYIWALDCGASQTFPPLVKQLYFLMTTDSNLSNIGIKSSHFQVFHFAPSVACLVSWTCFLLVILQMLFLSYVASGRTRHCSGGRSSHSQKPIWQDSCNLTGASAWWSIRIVALSLTFWTISPLFCSSLLHFLDFWLMKNLLICPKKIWPNDQMSITTLSLWKGTVFLLQHLKHFYFEAKFQE